MQLARITTLGACWVLIASVTAAALDLATSEPGRWQLVPRWAEKPLLLAPLGVSLGALAFGAVAVCAVNLTPFGPGRGSVAA